MDGGRGVFLRFQEKVVRGAVWQGHGVGADVEHGFQSAALRELRRGAGERGRAVLHQHQPIGTAEREGQVVQHHHDGLARVAHLGAQTHDLQLAVDVQISGGLVQQHVRRVLRKRHRDVRFLAFAARERGQQAVGVRVHTDAAHGALRDLAVCIARPARVAQVGEAAVEHQLPDVDVGHGARLGKVGNPLGELFGLEGNERGAVDAHLSGVRAEETCGGLEQRALAAAVGTKDRGDAAVGHGEGDAAQHGGAAVACGHVVKLDHAHDLPSGGRGGTGRTGSR